jgi:hypothetical protein
MAQVEPGNGLIIFNAGHVWGTSALTDDSVDGGALTFTYEMLQPVKPLSIGINIGYSSAQGDSGAGADQIKTNTNSVPFFFGGKYWLGKNKFQAYVGAAFGIYFSWFSRELVTTGERYDSIGDTGFGMAIPLGMAVSVSDKMFISANYTLNWLWEGDLLKDDILNSVNIGLGFKVK